MEGPIVIVNISMHRCDAFIVESSGIRLLELSQLTRSSFDDRDPQFYDTLVWLWETIVRPVLDAVGF